MSTAQEALDSIEAVVSAIPNPPFRRHVWNNTPSDYVNIGQSIARDIVISGLDAYGPGLSDETLAVTMTLIDRLPDASTKNVADYTPGDFVESGKTAVREAIRDALKALA